MDLTELTQRALAAKQIEDATARRVELRATFATLVEVRLAAIEDHLGVVHEGMDDLQQALCGLNESSGEAQGTRIRASGSSGVPAGEARVRSE